MTLLQKLEASKNLTVVEKEVVLYILQHADQIANLTISDLSSLTYTSNATIIRLCRKLGMSGYREFKMELLRDIERRRKQSSNIDINFPIYRSEASTDIMKKMAELSVESVNICYETISSKDLETAANYIKTCNNTYLFANGDSLLSAMSFTNRLIKQKKHVIIGNQYEETPANVYNIGENDVVIFVSYSGKDIIRQRYMDIIKQTGCKTVMISSSLNTEDYDVSITFPAKESVDKENYEGKISTFYSQISINYILNCIYTIIFMNADE